ncbi:MAG: gliding motility-associated C-terminal domain-containing protein, partial [Cytophagales bacterium]
IKIGLFSDYVNTLLGISKICKGENITITAINSKTNFWVNTNETTPKLVENPPNSTIYTFVGSNINQCKDTSLFPITVNKVPIDDVDFLKSSQNGYLCPEKSLFDTLSGPLNAKFTYNWTLDSKSIINNFNFFHVNKTGVYKLTITDSAGCKLSDTLLVTKKCDTIVIIPPAPIITIPNIFTPNNDGYNDVFEIKYLPSNSKIEIYNRWGSSVYQSDNYDNNWNGNGADDGLYYFKIEIAAKTYSGWLQMAR